MIAWRDFCPSRQVRALTLGLVTVSCCFFINARTSADTIYVSNSGNNTIVKYDSAGNSSVFASEGLSDPQGLAFDNSGNLYVANVGNNTIEKFDTSGNGSVFANSR